MVIVLLACWKVKILHITSNKTVLHLVNMITFHRFTAQMQFVPNMHCCIERKVNMQKSLKICKCLILIIRILIILLLGAPQTITFSYITTLLPTAIQTCTYWLT